MFSFSLLPCNKSEATSGFPLFNGRGGYQRGTGIIYDKKYSWLSFLAPLSPGWERGWA